MNIRVIAVIAWFIGVFFPHFTPLFVGYRRIPIDLLASEKLLDDLSDWADSRFRRKWDTAVTPGSRPGDPKKSWGVLYITRWKLTYCKPSYHGCNPSTTIRWITTMMLHLFWTVHIDWVGDDLVFPSCCFRNPSQWTHPYTMKNQLIIWRSL